MSADWTQARVGGGVRGALRSGRQRLRLLRGRVEAVRSRDRLRGVERVVVFVGYPRSGHSLVGALLDAHPDVLIAHEADLLRYVRLGAGRDALFGLLLARQRWFAARGRRWTGYDYQVEGQDTVGAPRVIGDKAGGMTTAWLLRQPDLLDRLRDAVGLPLAVIHHVRAPLDNLATVVHKDGLSADAAIDAWIERARRIAALLEALPAGEGITTRHEALVDDPRTTLTALASHLGLGAPAPWLDAASGVVFERPRRTAGTVPWSAAQRGRLDAALAELPWGAAYRG